MGDTDWLRSQGFGSEGIDPGQALIDSINRSVMDEIRREEFGDKYLNDKTYKRYFSTAREAFDYAKARPGSVVKRAGDGQDDFVVTVK